ncbi:MAG TPA: RnfABCDGE type electron transport complex subunit D [Candidatus Omnitrophota bacterium]|nr:RnfABCDGE type electron transport complex subunit D [Candidatus Omnitrophota bacterium]
MIFTDTGQPPFLRTPDSAARMSRRFFSGLLPVMAASAWVFGWEAVQVFSLAAVSCLLTESLWSRVSEKSFRIHEWSSVSTAVLLALLLPPGVSRWAVVLGGVAAILFGKMIFGGLGQNVFNPSLAGFAVLAVMPGFENVIVSQNTAGMDWSSVFLETGTGLTYGDVSKAAILFGGMLLVTRRLVPVRSPFVYLASAGIFSGLLGRNLLSDFIAGNTLLFAFFYVTDFASAPVTSRGRLVFSAAAGALTILLRVYDDSSAAGVYALLLMNAVAPLLDRIPSGRSSRNGGK